MKSGHIIILTTILASVIGTFFASNAITGLTVAKAGVQESNFASVTGHVTIGNGQASSIQTLAGSILFGMLAITALVVVARIGKNSVSEAMEAKAPNLKNMVKKANNAIDEGRLKEAHDLYSSMRSLYSKMQQEEKQSHFKNIMGVHQRLSQQAAIKEAQYLTEKYVDETISEKEFERLKQLIISQ